MKVQYNGFKLDCLWKGAIQQTETKQSKSILLSSFPFVCESCRQHGERFYKATRRICAWRRVMLYIEVVWDLKSTLALTLTFTSKDTQDK